MAWHVAAMQSGALGSRRAVERAAREALWRGEHVLIDRTNLDRAQRAHWLRLAHEVRACLLYTSDAADDVYQV